MLVTTTRHADRQMREKAKMLSFATGSIYCARGKKTVERTVMLARKKGEHTIAILSEGIIMFIGVSAAGWRWKENVLKFGNFKGSATECEIGSIIGKDAPVIADLFGLCLAYGGEAELRAEGGKLAIACGNEEVLEMDYEVAKYEEQGADES